MGNQYCEKHEYSAGMPGPCPDCAELTALHARLDAALLQKRDLEGVIAGALAVLRNSSLTDTKAAVEAGKILDAAVARMEVTEKRNCVICKAKPALYSDRCAECYAALVSGEERGR